MGKYFKYAIGEIILVVIGILIALSINNWNEKRQRKLSERTYLERLVEDLKNDSTYYSQRDSIYQINQIEIKKIADTFFNNQNKKGLDYVINNMNESLTELVISKNTYEEMVSTGILFSIDNKPLLTEIQDYFNWSEINQYYIKTNNNDLAAYWLKPFYAHITIADRYHKKKQTYDHLDFSSLFNSSHQNNIDLRAYLIKYEGISMTKLELFKQQLKYTNLLIESINKELQN